MVHKAKGLRVSPSRIFERSAGELVAAVLLALEPVSMRTIRRQAARLRRAIREEQAGQDPASVRHARR